VVERGAEVRERHGGRTGVVTTIISRTTYESGERHETHEFEVAWDSGGESMMGETDLEPTGARRPLPPGERP